MEKFVEQDEKQSIFMEEVKPFSIRVPEALMKKVGEIALTAGRSRDKQIIAMLAECCGLLKTNKGE